MNSTEMAELAVSGDLGYDTSEDTDMHFMCKAYLDLVDACLKVSNSDDKSMLCDAMDNDPLKDNVKD